jgi:hypothetical protein
MTAYERWYPIEGIPETLHLDRLISDAEGFRLILLDADGRLPPLRIRFAGRVACQMSHILTAPEWPFYTASDSEYLRWFHSQTLNIGKDFSSYRPTHYSIQTPSIQIDVLSRSKPTVEWL